MSQDDVCHCPTRGFPLCGFCDDDRFCPQCGQAVAQISSDAEQGAERIVWVYGEGAAFTFPLSLTYHGRNRELLRGCPKLKPDCRLDPTNFFEERVEVLAPDPDQQAVRVSLKRRGTAVLPHTGLRANFRAVGDFPARDFKLLICRQPEFEVQLSGDGVLNSENGGQRKWPVWKEGKLELELVIRALTAPVRLERPLEVVSDGKFSARLLTSLPAEETLIPDAPRALSLEIDTSDWEVEDERQFTLILPLACCPQQFQVHTLERVALGDIEFSSETLLIESLHLGDVLSTDSGAAAWMPLEVRNVGAALLQLHPPAVTVDDPAHGKDWIEVTWRGSEALPDPRPLDVNERAELRVVLDLRRIDAQRLSPDRPLAATITVTDDLNRPWELRLRIGDVRRLAECPHTVALDFGSTNSYAAVWDDSDEESAEGRLRALLGQADPERFPSVIYFERADEQQPQYLVGREALSRGLAFPPALVSGLKRWIGVPDAPRRHVRDRHGGEASFDVATLVQFMLEDMLRQSEATLKQVVRRIGVTFPAGFGPQRVAAMQQILAQLAERRAAASPPRSLEWEELRIDEAIAVALGFVLDPRMLEEHVQPLLQRVQRQGIVVGSFDFGGGTIDTALLRVTFQGPHVRIARLASTFLGIGGDDQFGGDNVTMAVLELLRREILARANPARDAAAGAPVELPMTVPTGSGRDVAEANFKILWNAAEQIKFQLCQPPHESARRVLAEMLRLEMPRLKFTQAGAPKQAAELHEDLQAAAADERLIPELARVYDHTLEQDLMGKGGYSVHGRVEACVAELAGFATSGREPVEVDFLILAGASCRLPSLTKPGETLVEDLLSDKFPGAKLVYDAARAKSKVAFGLARYLGLQEMQPDRVRGLRPAMKYTSDELVWLDRGSGAHYLVVPACSPIDDAERSYLLPLPLTLAWSSDRVRKLPLHRRGRGRPQLIGYFDLRQPVDGNELPQSVSDEALASVRLDGAETALLLKVEFDGRVFGNWPLVACTDERQLRS